MTAPAAVAVKVETPPPAELVACPEPVEGFPLDAVATMPPKVRFAAIRLATAFAKTRAQLARLIRWTDPTACPAKD